MRIIYKRQHIYASVSLPVAGILSLNYFYSVKKKKQMTDPATPRNNPFLYQLRTFKYAFTGLKNFFKAETKSIIHLVAAIAAIVLGIVFGISATEWLMITFSIGIVFVSEIFNTAIEKTVDLISLERTKQAGLIKDLAAAAVLLAALTALAIGLIIFIPKLIEVL